MPIGHERVLQAEAREKIHSRFAYRNGKKIDYGSVGKHRDAFVYGTLRNKYGWKPHVERPAGE